MVAPSLCAVPWKISINAPTAPNPTPSALFLVIRSPMSTPLSTSTRIGVATMMMLACTGEVRMSPWKNISWLMATPDTPQSTNRFASLQATRSRLSNHIGQKRRFAPATRSRMRPEGPITPGIRPFATT